MPKKRTITVFIFISLIMFSFFVKRIESGTIEEQPDLLTPQSKDDLQITLTTNVTTIGKQGGALANLTLNNTGINPCGDINVDFSLDDDYLNFTSTYQEHQEIALLNIDTSLTLNVEVAINESKIPTNPNAADVCLIIDGSWSMVDEIDSVKAEIQALIVELQENITDLRMGIIIHGWKEYSEYPSNDSRNYIELTDDAQSVSDFIDTVYADGGVEPWGDALAYIDGWDWRNVAKLVILIGDEDCDPGILVGSGSTADYYNGSELVDAVDALKSRGVILNSIRCGNADKSVFVNQYTWVAEYTGGESVDLDEAINSGFPGGIPDLIEHWTLELEREYYITLSANVSWTELDPPNYDHEAQTSVLLTLDIAPP